MTTRTPWADRIADRIVKSDLARKPPQQPQRPPTPRPTPVDSARATPRPRPIPAEQPVPARQSGGFLEQFLNTPDALDSLLGDAFAEGGKLAGRFAKTTFVDPFVDVGKAAITGFNAFQEGGNAAITDILTTYGLSDEQAARALTEASRDVSNYGRGLTGRGVLSDLDFEENVQSNLEASQRAREVLEELGRFGMSPVDAARALSEILESRPLGTQVVGAAIDPLAVAGPARAGVRALRTAVADAPDVLRSAGRAVTSNIPVALGPPTEGAGFIDDIPSGLTNAQNELDIAREELTAIRETRGGPAPKFGTPERVEFDALRQQASAAGQPVKNKKQLITEAQAKIVRAQSNVNALQTEGIVAPGTSVQGGFGIGEPVQQVGLDLGGGGTGPVAPLIESEQVSELGRLAAERRAGQQGFDLAEPVADIPEIIPTDADLLFANMVANRADPIGAAGVPEFARLPEELRRAKPRFRTQEIEFERDLDKALYIIGNPSTRSKRDADYLNFVQTETGLDEGAARARGREVRNEVGRQSGGDDPIQFAGRNRSMPKIGDEVVVNGTPSFVADTQSVEGVRHELFSPAGDDARAAIRIIDEDTGQVVENRGFPDFDTAQKEYDDSIQVANGGNSLDDIIDKPIRGVDEIPNAPEDGPPEVGEVGGGAIPPTSPPTSFADDPPFDPDDALAWFRRYLADPQRALESQYGREIQRRARAGRSVDYEDRLRELTSQGVGAEDALAQAQRETLSGSLPVGPTAMHVDFAPAVREALYERLRQFDFGAERLERAGTKTALDNALRGRPIPREPGTAGGSAFSRLQRVFGDEIVEALDNRQTLEEVIALRQPGASPEAIERAKQARVRGLNGQDPAVTSIPPEFGPRPPDVQFGELTQQALDDELRGVLDPPLVPSRLEPPVERVPLPRDFRTETEKELYRLFLRQIINREVPGVPRQAIEDLLTSRLPEDELFAAVRNLMPDGTFVEIPATPFGGVTQQALDPGAAFALDPAQEPIGALNQPARPHNAVSPEQQVEQNKQFTKWQLAQERSILTDGRLILDMMKPFGLGILDFFDGIRGFKSSWDASWLRQQTPLIVSNLDGFKKGWVAFAKSLRSETVANQMDRVRKTRRVWAQYFDGPNEELADVLQDIMRPLSGPEASSYRQAEEFPGRGGTRPVQKVFARIPFVRASGRAHISALNASNYDIIEKAAINYERFNDSIRSSEKQFVYKFIFNRRQGNRLPSIRKVPIEPLNIEKELLALGKGIRDMTGRGAVPTPIRGLTRPMNSMFFSLRNNIGRFLTPTHLFRGTARSRKAAWKNISSSIATFSAVIFLGERVGLWEVEIDRRSADFMKIRMGKIRIDPWGGYQQFVTFIARNLPEIGGLKSTTTGQIRDRDLFGSTEFFAKAKASPLAALMIEVESGKTFTGDKVDFTDIDQWLDRTLQFSVNDFRELYLSEGLKGLPYGLPGIVGSGIIVYDLPRWEDLDPYYQMHGNDDIKKGKITTTSGLREAFRQRNPEMDARLFVRGDVTILMTRAAKRFVLDIMAEHKVDPKDVKGYKKVFKNTPVPPRTFIQGSDQSEIPETNVPTQPQQDAPVQQQIIQNEPSFEQIFDSSPTIGKGDARSGLAALWEDGTFLTPDQRTYLHGVFTEFPLGQTNFNTWLRQTLRQKQSNEVLNRR